MAPGEHLLIFGASARAAVFSALRAGLRPWCADLFADADLQACCPVLPLAPADYPQGFLEVAKKGPPGPWLYTGALENHPAFVRKLARIRPLWGNNANVLGLVRSPGTVRNILRTAGLPCPDLVLPDEAPPRSGRWLAKPFRGASGAGIRLCKPGIPPPTRQFYFQEFIDGEACAAIYLGHGSAAHLLGVTRQLVGEDWLHARPFAYCCSVGPLPLIPSLRSALDRLGDALLRGAGLRGLFGVDFILRDGVPWPVEINPRYTASVEVLEMALGIPVLGLHRQVFESSGPLAWPQGRAPKESDKKGVIGKAILFAQASVVFPGDGPWLDSLRQWGKVKANALWDPPDYADIPPKGQCIQASRPILTFFARAATAFECVQRLRQIALDLDRCLWKT
jgi:predicted ATP-grasp superfamily ATP-dependent carboligase